MNYIKELNAFRNWLLLNELSTSAIALWHTLMAINNMTGWQEWFTVPNSTLQQLTNLSKQGLDNARNQLKNKGLIDYQKGKKGQAGKYKMISLVNSVDQSIDQSVDQFVDQSIDQSIDQSVDQDLTINKHKQNKTKQKNNGYTPEFEEFWKHYPRKVGKREAFAKWRARIKEETPERLIEACINYARECERLGTEKRFIKHPKTFLSDKKPYEDYLGNHSDSGNDEQHPSFFDLEAAFNMHLAQGGDPAEFSYDKWLARRQKRA